MNCSDPPSISNGGCTPVNDTLLHASCPFICNPGYNLHGDDTIHCTVISGGSSVAWNGTAPTCNSELLSLLFYDVMIEYKLKSQICNF